MKIVAIVGSPRATGNTNYLVDQALKEAAAHGLETEKILLGKYRINPCLGHDNCASFSTCKQDDDAPSILEKFSSADGIILATPVYYYNMTAQMKTFIDRNYFLYTHEIPLQARCLGLIVVAGGEGIDHTVRALRRCFSISSNSDQLITVTGYANNLGEVKTNSTLIDAARNMGHRMAEILVPTHTHNS